MTLNDTIGLSLRNLRQSKLRTTLTMLGVSIGIASLAGMVSLGVGLQDQVVGRFMRSGLFGNITVTSQADLPGAFAQLGRRGRGAGNRRGDDNSASATPPAPLDANALKQISGLEHVSDVYPNLRFPVEFVLADFTRGILAAGIPMSSKGEGAFQGMTYGRFFNADSENGCLVSLDFAKQVDPQNPAGIVGKNVKLNYAATPDTSSLAGTPFEALGGFQVRQAEYQCPVVGVVERESGPQVPGVAAVTAVMIPMAAAEKIDAEIVTNPQALLRDPAQARSYPAITVKVAQPQFTQDVEDRIKKLGYTAFSVDDALRGAKNAFIILDLFLSLIGSIALAVSSLGIVNTMVMSILERTREIGIMKAIGASDNDVRRIFLFEASVIGLLGGVVGVVIGWVVGRLINLGANIYIQSQGGTPGTLFSLPLWLIASAIVFSIGVSLAAGSYPASRAARLDPIQALRHD